MQAGKPKIGEICHEMSIHEEEQLGINNQDYKGEYIVIPATP